MPKSTHMEIHNLTVATAMSLYQYNVSPGIRAEKILDHFLGDCMEPIKLLRAVDSRFWATEMPAPTALVYLAHAMNLYGIEAAERVRINLSE